LNANWYKNKERAMYYYRRLPQFEYVAPGSLKEAASFLQAHPRETRVMAGGTILLHRMKERIGVKKYVMSLKAVPGLDAIGKAPGQVKIGSMVTIQTIADAPVVRRQCGLLAAACRMLGTPQIRSMGTIGGNVACNLATAEIVPVLIALDAQATLAGAKGSRTVSVEELYKEVRDGEFVTEILVPVKAGQAWGYEKWAMRKRFDYATVSAAVAIAGTGRVCKDAKIALGGVTLLTRRARRAEEILKGRSLTNRLIVEAAEAAAEDARTGADIHFTAEYKKELIKVMVSRALKQAVSPGKEG
jgi:carbon-monoxide dehydrogenase medium subunit